MDDARALLDSLMGHNRNADEGTRKQQRGRWKSSEVCKHFLVAFCPYGLFEGTRAELGPCGRLHEEVLRSAYNAEASDSTKAKYERRFLGFLRDLIHSLDRKIQREQGRLDLEDQESGSIDPENPDAPRDPNAAQRKPDLVFSDAQRERLDKIENEIEDKKDLMEKYGNEGRVDKAQDLLSEVEALKQEKLALHEKAKVQANWATPQDRCLKMCEVCGAYLDRRDSQQRKDNHLKGRVHEGHRDNHLKGRVHIGYSLIRETAVELEEKEVKRKEQEEKEKDKEALSKAEKELRSDDEKDTSDKDRGRRSRSRSRSRKRRRRRSRSRSRSRRRRRSRSRSGRRSRRRRHRSRS